MVCLEPALVGSWWERCLAVVLGQVAIYSRRLLMNGVYRAYNSWKQYVRRMRRVKRMLDFTLKNGVKARFSTWAEYTETCKKARKFVVAALTRVYMARRCVSCKSACRSYLGDLARC